MWRKEDEQKKKKKQKSNKRREKRPEEKSHGFEVFYHCIKNNKYKENFLLMYDKIIYFPPCMTGYYCFVKEWITGYGIQIEAWDTPQVWTKWDSGVSQKRYWNQGSSFVILVNELGWKFLCGQMKLLDIVGVLQSRKK